ncbi:MAG: LCP family protein [bacterium]|nr:MAG: LCP family protein [bacterium]
MSEILKNPYKLSILIGAIFISGMLLGSFGYLGYLKANAQNDPQPQTYNTELPELIEEERETSDDADRFNILLMGHGGAGHSGGGLMDAIMVVSVNTTDKKASIISIPRDYWFSGHKLNADPSIRDAVTAITGLFITNQITIDFNNFVKMIDNLNGITVDAKKAYVDNFYPVRGKENDLCGFSNEKIVEVHQKYTGFELEKQFLCRYETISYGVGLNSMNGEEALKYVRSRHGDGDFGRSMRQFEVLKAILQKGNISVVSKALSFVKTDLNNDSLSLLITQIGNPLEYSISYLGLSDQNVLTNSKSSQGAYILIPKSGVSIKDYIKNSI